MNEIDWVSVAAYIVGALALGFGFILLTGERVQPTAKHWLEQAILIDGIRMPSNLRFMAEDILYEEGIEPPKKMTAKFIDQLTGRFMGGYTRHDPEESEICIVYGPRSLGEHEIQTEERETVLHEVVHWIMGPDEGHSARFYSKLFELCLKHKVDTDYMIRNELSYMGTVVFDGISLFDKTYNG